jgi:DNA mismatch repair protein MutS
VQGLAREGGLVASLALRMADAIPDATGPAPRAAAVRAQGGPRRQLRLRCATPLTFSLSISWEELLMDDLIHSTGVEQIGRVHSTQANVPAHSGFRSILFEPDDADHALPGAAPDYFHDLGLDQIEAALFKGLEEYDLAPFFRAPLHSVSGVTYRQQVMRDLEDPALRSCVERFASAMRSVRQQRAHAEKLHCVPHRQRWFLRAAESYVRAVRALSQELANAPVAAPGMRAFRAYVEANTASQQFGTLAAEMQNVVTQLAALRYCILAQGDRFTVRPYSGEADYSVEVAAIFEKFQQGAVTDYRVRFRDRVEMNHVEEKVLEFVAQLNPGPFGALESFCRAHAWFVDPGLVRFDREIHFYLAFLKYAAGFQQAGLAFCRPMVSSRHKEVLAEETYDLALAGRLIEAGQRIVCNDIHLAGAERILLVSGPNQGGKTTFARTFGQLHHLAALGCKLPGRRVQMFLFDALYTHFEREEDIRTQRGKLQDDLVRIHDILSRATSRSVVVMNEIFNSTTLHDAVFLADKVLERLIALDALCICVTFLDELAGLSPSIVSMVSTVNPDNPADRTFKVVRRPADGRAYAISIAEKYRITWADLLRRIPSGNEVLQ